MGPARGSEPVCQVCVAHPLRQIAAAPTRFAVMAFGLYLLSERDSSAAGTAELERGSDPSRLAMAYSGLLQGRAGDQERTQETCRGGGVIRDAARIAAGEYG